MPQKKVEQAILTGRIVQIQRDDSRGNKYLIDGTAADSVTPLGVVGRFLDEVRFLIVTVYKTTGV